MQGGEKRYAGAPQRDISEIIAVQVDHIEFARSLRDGLQHRDQGRDVIADSRIEPERPGAPRDKRRRRRAVAAGERRHLVTQGDERVGQIGDDALGAAVEFRRDGFHQRRDLSNPHRPSEILRTVNA